MAEPDLEAARQKAADRQMRAEADRALATTRIYSDASNLPPFMRRLHEAQMRAYRGEPAPEPPPARKVRRFFTAGS